MNKVDTYMFCLLIPSKFKLRPDQKAAEAAAVAQFDLSEDQRKRLALRERG